MRSESPDILDRPIFLIGAARSGTTFIAEALSRHPDVAFWNEPKYVWRHGAASAPDDYRPPEHATPKVSAYIRQRFLQFTQSRGAARFLEKTPSNCFRVAFMHAVFPEALFLHLVRDGRDAAASALQRWRSAPDDGAIWRRIRGLEIPVNEWLAYGPDIVREALLRRLQPGRGHVWGPRYPGMLEEMKGLDIPSACARQWIESERAARAQFSVVPPEQRLHFRYEDFLRHPQETLNAILAFTGLREDPHLASYVEQKARPGQIGASRRRLSQRELETIDALCTPAMRELGISPG